MEEIKIALVQLSCGPDVTENELKTIRHIREAAEKGAKIICLQELFNAKYFPQNVDAEFYNLAMDWPGKTGTQLMKLAADLQVVLIVPVYEKAAPGIYFNSVFIIDADGVCIGKYRKTHIPDGPQYHEKYYFTPGNLGYPVFDTRYGRIAVAICWDEWYPEVSRILALKGPFIIFYPSAIGSEPDHPDLSTYPAWETVIRSHGIANGLFVAAVNRVGPEDDMCFYGQSFVADPFGAKLAEASDSHDEVLLADIDLSRIKKQRDILQFFRDRRIDTYQEILQRIIE
ncbi:MAG: carbon-nitrogen hydrolase [Cyclobacteriaceae bacterium]|nr:carbon-nitrogen hydrolase [Cyclobacteriaceae bacterium]